MFEKKYATTKEIKKYAEKRLVDNVILTSDARLGKGEITIPLAEAIHHNMFISGDDKIITESFLMPNIMQGKESFVINTPSASEVLRRYGMMLFNDDYEIKIIDYNNPEKSLFYNPFFYVEGKKDARLIAKEIIDITNSDDPERNKILIEIFTDSILQMISQNNEITFSELLNIISERLKLTGETNGADYVQLFSGRRMDKKLFSYSAVICAEILSRLIKDSPIIEKTTVRDEVALDKIASNKTAFFIINPLFGSDFAVLLNTLFVKQMGIVVAKVASKGITGKATSSIIAYTDIHMAKLNCEDVFPGENYGIVYDFINTRREECFDVQENKDSFSTSLMFYPFCFKDDYYGKLLTDDCVVKIGAEKPYISKKFNLKKHPLYKATYAKDSSSEDFFNIPKFEKAAKSRTVKAKAVECQITDAPDIMK